MSCTKQDSSVICYIPEGGPINGKNTMSLTFGVWFALVDINRPIDLTLVAVVSASEPSVEGDTCESKMSSVFFNLPLFPEHRCEVLTVILTIILTMFQRITGRRH